MLPKSLNTAKMVSKSVTAQHDSNPFRFILKSEWPIMGGLELSGLESSQIQMRSEASAGCGEICFSQNRYCPLGDGGWVTSGGVA